MKTDVIEISPAGEGMAEALKETERAASYRGLTPKESLRLRLLAEEMMGMLRTIVGEERSRFWVEAELKSALPGVEALTFDLEKLEYISSAGLRVLLSAQKTMNKQGTMKVTRANEMILEIFEVTGFSDILTIE